MRISLAILSYSRLGIVVRIVRGRMRTSGGSVQTGPDQLLAMVVTIRAAYRRSRLPCELVARTGWWRSTQHLPWLMEGQSRALWLVCGKAALRHGMKKSGPVENTERFK